MAAPSNMDLFTVLHKAGITTEVTDAMAKMGCTTLQLFVDWVKDISEVDCFVLKTSKESDKLTIATLKGV